MKKFAILWIAALISRGVPSAADTAADPAKTEQQKWIETIRYGTDTEIAALIETLKTENVDYLDTELIQTARNTHNRNILTGLFSFFADREKPDLQGRALQALEDWDAESAAVVTGAIEYLGKLKIADGAEPLRKLLDSEERRYMNVSFRALGRIGGGNSALADDIAAYLMEYYEGRLPGDEYQRELVAAVGETGSKKGIDFLSAMADNNDARIPLRIAALESLAKIGDGAGKDAVIRGVSSQDPNVRSAAIAALGPFSGSDVDAAILEAFRDSFWRSRLGAAQSAEKRKLAAAVPYLGYRAEWDEVPSVKDAAIRALGAIGNPESTAVLESLFGERKRSDRVRALAAEMLMREKPDAYAGQVIAELDEAKKKNQTALYNGLLRVAGSSKTKGVLELAERMLRSGGAVEKAYALDMAVTNNFVSLRDQIQELADPKNGNLSRKAQRALEILGK
jgi:HEAT repeat protein